MTELWLPEIEIFLQTVCTCTGAQQYRYYAVSEIDSCSTYSRLAPLDWYSVPAMLGKNYTPLSAVIQTTVGAKKLPAFLKTACQARVLCKLLAVFSATWQTSLDRFTILSPYKYSTMGFIICPRITMTDSWFLTHWSTVQYSGSFSRSVIILFGVKRMTIFHETGQSTLIEWPFLF